MECPNCDGTGYVYEDDEHPEEECVECNGAGWLEDDDETA